MLRDALGAADLAAQLTSSSSYSSTMSVASCARSNSPIYQNKYGIILCLQKKNQKNKQGKRKENGSKKTKEGSICHQVGWFD